MPIKRLIAIGWYAVKDGDCIGKGRGLFLQRGFITQLKIHNGI